MLMLPDDGKDMTHLEDTYHFDEMARLVMDRWWMLLNYSKRQELLQLG
jgi:hypothetical protein